MRLARIIASVAAAALLALGAAACGADEEPVADTEGTAPTTEKTDRAQRPTTQQAAPATTAPPATSTADVTPAPVTAAPATQAAPAPGSGGGTGSGGTGGGSGGGGGGGSYYDPNQPDSEENDTPPPRGSPAEEFEEECDRHPEACG
jgi:hypothetical protein